MANVTPALGWNDVYRIEDTDYADGGEDGLSNRQAKQLQGNLVFVRETMLGPIGGGDTGGQAGDIDDLQNQLDTLGTTVGINESDIAALNTRTSDLEKTEGGIKDSAEITANMSLSGSDHNGMFLPVNASGVTVTVPTNFTDTLPYVGRGHVILYAQQAFTLHKPNGTHFIFWGGDLTSGSGADNSDSTYSIDIGSLLNIYVYGNTIFVHNSASA